MENGHTLFDLFDGIRPMAKHLGERPSTVQDWKNHGRIPATKQPAVLRVARALGLTVDPLFIIFPLGIPDDLIAQRDLFDDVATVCVAVPHGGRIVSGGNVVACDRRPISQRTVKAIGL